MLGLAAVIEAHRALGDRVGCQHSRGPWTNECARPLYHWAIFLTALAAVPLPIGRRDAGTGGPLVSARRQEPAADRVALRCHCCLSAACYFRWLSHLPRIALIACATLAAFGLWGLGVVIQRTELRSAGGWD